MTIHQEALSAASDAFLLANRANKTVGHKELSAAITAYLAVSSQPANPAHGVSDEMVEAALNSWFDGEIPVSFSGDFRADMRAALTAAIGAGEQAVADIVPEGCTGSALAFEPGTLHVNKNGSGYIAVDEEAWQLEDDRCEGVDGPEGSVHWITRLDAIEMQALRDFLNGAPRPHPAPSGQAVAVEPLEWVEHETNWWSADPKGLGFGYEVRLTDRGTTRIRMPAQHWDIFEGTVAEAKADAQADYERRIRSALAHPVQPGWREVGEAGTMPSTSGFTMACFDAAEIPVGTKLYAAPQPKGE